LFLNGLHYWSEDVEGSGFLILEYLSRRPDITNKLESFVWTVKTHHNPEDYCQSISDYHPRYIVYPEEDRQPVRLLTDSKRAIPALPCSSAIS
jgi:hypothetical protein